MVGVAVLGCGFPSPLLIYLTLIYTQTPGGGQVPERRAGRPAGRVAAHPHGGGAPGQGDPREGPGAG